MILLCMFTLLLTIPPCADAAIKVVVVVSHVAFDVDTATVRFVVDIGDGHPLVTNRTFNVTGVLDPATILLSIKNLVVTFMLNQHGVVVVVNEVVVYGAPQ